MATPHFDEKEYDVLDKLTAVIRETKAMKPNDRSEKDRRYAIVVTELEKVWCIYNVMINAGYEFPENQRSA